MTQKKSQNQNQTQSTGNGRPRNELAQVKEQTVGAVEARINELVGNHQLVLPPNYSVGNALQAAWLALQEVKDKNKRPALEVCSRTSVVQSLFSMVVQGLDPGRKQGYFIVYGQQLVFQRSYFGTLAVAKRIGGVLDAYAEIVYEGDELEYEIVRGNKQITRHAQKLDNIDGTKIRAAYAVVVFADERRPDHTELMTWDQIQKAWAKSKMNPQSADSTHKQFPEEMAKKTVLSRALKRHINSSSDDHLFLREFNRSEVVEAEEDMAEAVEAHANRELVDTAPDDRTIDAEAPSDATASAGELAADDEQLAAGDSDRAAAEAEPEQAPF